MANVDFCCVYDVFLCFVGKDTRKSFIDFLYKALKDAGFHTFRDDKEIEKGKNIHTELENCIKHSRMSLVVFSKNYAKSQWFLDEVAKIMEHKRIAPQHKVLPIFYDVKPLDVRHQAGSFAEVSAEKMKAWRASVEEAADLQGLDLHDQQTAGIDHFVQKIVNKVREELGCKIWRLDESPKIGLEAQAKPINEWLEANEMDIGVAVIFGMGGIGKTTLARFVYDHNIAKFDHGSFIDDINKASEEPRGLIRKQQQLLFDLTRKKLKIHSFDEGMSHIERVLGLKKVLLVLDAVDNSDQLDAIINKKKWLLSGSRVIITTRTENLLKSQHGDFKSFEVELLNNDQSLHLFRQYAFPNGHPVQEQEACLNNISRYCEGLPLALKVLAASLFNKGIHEWKSLSENLEKIPRDKILRKLQLSYDLLDDDDRKVFLDIACLFSGKKKDYVIRVLDACDRFSIAAIETIKDRCLISIIGDRLIMHQLLRDLGREIVYKESPEEPGKRSRLWHQSDIFKVVKEGTGSEKIEGLTLDKSMPLNHDCSSDQGDIGLKTAAFAKMINLMLLKLKDVQVCDCGGYDNFPGNIRWLCWHGFAPKSIPDNFQLQNLVVLEMRKSNLKYLWIETKQILGALKVIDLSGSRSLVRTPNFENIPNLERLVLEDCVSLFDLHRSVRDLTRLEVSNLSGCVSLRWN